MGYKIIYGQDPVKKYSFTRIQGLICCFFLLFSFTVRLFWPAGAQVLRQAFVTDQFSHGALAVMEMVEDLQQGESVSDAVSVFCQEILHGQ